jgi:hypothetical protein
MNELTEDLFEVQYEADYLKRSIAGGITKYTDVALTELIANAHDAGATKVNITLPNEIGQLLVIEDNGTGMSAEHFKSRWLKLSYNRLNNQGEWVNFPPDLSHIKRKAYGRNGVGRHGLLCFGGEYTVETWRDDEFNRFLVSSTGDKPLKVLDHKYGGRKGHGTRLEVRIEKGLQSIDVIHEMLSQRFFSMDDFVIEVNQKKVELGDHPGVIDSRTFEIGEAKFKVTLVDTKVSRKDSHFQGVGVWVGGRRVGDQDWRLGGESITDGRKSFSKRYAAVVETDGLRGEILPDWSGFNPKSEPVSKLATVLKDYIAKKKKSYLKEEVEALKNEALSQVNHDMSDLPTLARADVSDFIDEILEENPDLDISTLILAVKAAINLERSHFGQNLLQKLTMIEPGDVEALDLMLEEWSARDAFKALNEIDTRLKVIEALARLTEDKSADELHTIHPLVLRARWLFGHEFETPSYVSSNVGLVKTIKKVFGKRIASSAFENARKRPDIVALKDDSALAGYAVEDVDIDDQVCVKKVLLIEVKRGGFEINREEMNQAEGYVNDMTTCGILMPRPYITSFVVGESISPNMSPRKKLCDENDNEVGVVIAKPYAVLISTAEARLFKLRQALEERYDSMKTEKLKDQSLKVNNTLL